MDRRTDSELIRESLRAPATFGAIFDRHFRTVFRYVRRRVGDSGAADLSSEVFTRAFADRARFGGDGESALPWLFGIATNLIRMQYRNEERRLRAYGRAAGQDVAVFGVETPEDRVDAQAARGVLAEALVALSARQRDVLLLSAWAELSPSEIAVALSMRPGTVRSELHRARTTLAARLSVRAPHLVPDQEPTR